jgi:hypothetical protein
MVTAEDIDLGDLNFVSIFALALMCDGTTDHFLRFCADPVLRTRTNVQGDIG